MPVRTDTLICHAVYTDTTTTRLRSKMPNGWFDMHASWVRDAFGGNTVPDTEFSLEHDPKNDVMILRHAKINPVHISVTPPESDDEPAHMEMRVKEMYEKIEIDSDASMLASKMATYIAWEWMVIRGDLVG